VPPGRRPGAVVRRWRVNRSGAVVLEKDDGDWRSP
jgi:hypothetical protein